jgi:hypothetical protein
MSDGRHFTDYRPRCAVNYESLPNPMSSFDYRMFLTHNADQIMDNNRAYAYKENLCEPCTDPSTMLPESHIQVCDARSCTFPLTDPAGLGIGRKYGGEQPSYRDESYKGCAASVNDMAFFPVTGKVGDDFEKLVGPTGAVWPQ